ncbi:MAG: TonB-dependent receptor, partial [Luminiphilus sp.]|nr:TonB-dependent receptor [Luminiphilus sp.]
PEHCSNNNGATMAAFRKHLILVLSFSAASQFAISESIDETVIVADRIKTTKDSLAVSVNVIDRELISALGSATLPQLLRSQVGISTTQTGGIGAVSGIRVRGQDAFRTRVLIDGIDISDPSSPQIAPRMEHIASGALERVEVLRGTQGLLWGADAGGVIALSSRQGSDQPRIELNVELGGYGFETETLVASTGTMPFGELTAVLNHVEMDGFNALQSDTQLADEDGYYNDSYQLSYTTSEWKGWSSTLSARKVDAKTDYDSCGRFDENFSFISSNDCSDGYNNETRGIVLRHEGDKQSTQIRMSESDSDRAYFTDGLFQFALQGSNEQLSLSHKRNLTDSYDLTVGFDQDEQSYDDGFGSARSRGNDAMFLNIRRLGDTATLSAAVRSDDNDDFGRHNSWRLTALTDTGIDGVAFKAAYGTGFRAPSPYEVGSNQSPWALAEARETPLNEEKSRGWEMGLRVSGDTLTWEVTYFDQEVSDAIVYRYSPALFAGGYLQIPGTSQFNGIEATGTWALNDSASVEAFISDLSAEDADGSGLPYRPETTAQITARFSGDKSEWLLLARYTSDRHDGFGTTLDDYTVIDGAFRYAVSEGVNVSLRAENLTNEGYSDIVGYRSAGRTMYLGLNISI